jgi:ribosomal protein S18 acetylase RimI-like enzyme
MDSSAEASLALPGSKIRLLQPGDEALAQALLEACADYCQLVTGLPPGPSDGMSLLVGRPEGRGPEDKFVFGLFTQPARLIGVLDVIRDHPNPRDWFIGLVLLGPSHRSQGLGRRLYLAFETWAVQQGVRSISLGVVEQNERAYRFWSRLGFEPIEKRPPRRYGNRESAVIVMKRSLSPE